MIKFKYLFIFLFLFPANLNVGDFSDLDFGFELFDNGNYNTIPYFTKAIKDLDLTSSGKIFVYWSLFKCYEYKNDTDGMLESLLAFYVNYNYFYKDKKYEYLIKTFDLKSKIELSMVLMEALWSRKSDYYCRTLDYPCYLPEEKYLDNYKNIIPFCDGEIKIVKENLINVFVICNNKIETYYFRELQ